MNLPPVRQLVLKDNQLFHKTSSVTPIPFMNTPEISIVGKGRAQPYSRESGFWTYPFDLNANVDPIWVELFQKHIGLNRDAAPSFSVKRMTLECVPGNLDIRYKAIKDAIRMTNTEYETQRENLITRVKEDMIKRDDESQQNVKAAGEIRQAFDNLEL
jgi:hypothetical protein